MNYQEILLSSICVRNQLEKAKADEALKVIIKAKVTADYFSFGHKILFEIIAEQLLKDLVLDQDILESKLSQYSLDDDKKNEIRIIFSTCREQTVTIEKLEEIIPAFIEQINTSRFSETLLTTGRILTEGFQSGKAKLKGLKDAKKYLIGNISGLKNNENTPEGAIQDSIDKFWENYNYFEANPLAGVKSGFKWVDKATNGFRKGELYTIAGYTGDGKSQILRNWFYYPSVFQGKNVVYVTLEMPMDQILNQIMSLHSLHPKFGFKEGIPVKSIDDGILTLEQKQQLELVTQDWKNNSNYGRAFIKQLPHGSTVFTIREFLTYLSTVFPIDCVYLDYAGLLNPTYNRQTVIADYTFVYNDLKGLCMDFNGEGVPIVSGWQVSTQGREDAERHKDKRYTLKALAESAGVARASDYVFSTLYLDDFKENHEVKMQTLKCRRGPLLPDWIMVERFNFSNLADMSFEIPKMDIENKADFSLLD